MIDTNVCPLCSSQAQLYGKPPMNLVYDVDCPCCGLFSITEEAIERLYEERNIQNEKVKIACSVRERNIKKLPSITLFSEPVKTDVSPKANSSNFFLC